MKDVPLATKPATGIRTSSTIRARTDRAPTRREGSKARSPEARDWEATEALDMACLSFAQWSAGNPEKVN
jgi:hypothetical protein